MAACNKGSKNGIKLLLDYSDTNNIDLNIEDNFGWTGFMYACRNGPMTQVVKILNRHSGRQAIDYLAKNNRGKTAIAIGSGNY